ncbi:MAG: hypothetical protein IJ395_02585 [Clostridia bacterium]|nr:hypothetical protein [Clostridia bacterium]
MKKKNLFAAILAIILVFYSVNTYFIFSSVRGNYLEDFNRYTSYLNEFCLDIVNRDYDIERTVREVRTVGFGFPTAAILYDSEGNVVSQTGAYVEIIKDESFCRLDDYLTSDIRKQICEFGKDHGMTVKCLDYNIKNGEIIPVRMLMSQTGSWRDVKEEVVFSEEKAEYSSDYVTWYFNTKSWEIDENHHNHKLYKLLCEKAFSEDVLNGVSDELAGWTGDSIEIADSYNSGSFDEYYTTDFYSIDGEKYVLHIRSEFNPFLETLFSSDFIYLQMKLTVIYLLIGAVILAVANKKYKKYINS